MPTITTATAKEMREHLTRISTTAEQARTATTPAGFRRAVFRNNEADSTNLGGNAWVNRFCILATVDNQGTADIVCDLSADGRRFLTGERS